MSRTFHGIKGSTHSVKIRLPRELLLFTVVAGLISLTTVNPVQTLGAVLLVPILFMLLWRPGEMPVLLFACGYQWLQVAMPIISADVSGIGLADHPLIPNLATASVLGLLTVLSLALGMRVGRGPPATARVQQAGLEIHSISKIRLLIAYALSHALTEFAVELGGAIPGLRQPTIALLSVRWVMVFLILWKGLVDPRFRWIAAGVAGFEIFIGLLEFFSGWKQVLFLGIVVAIGASGTPRRLLRPSVGIIIVMVLGLALFWQSIKEDYRDFMNQGTMSQSVMVSAPEQIGFLADKLFNLTGNDIGRGFESGVDRVGYLEYFGRSIAMVPSSIPHQDGRLWLEAVRHPVTPRLLFPNKSAIDDSDRVNEFSGVRVADADQGTSISLGYAAESYIDFGPYLMFFPIILLGAFLGMSYRLLTNTSRSALLSLGFATTLILSTGIYYETSNIKIFGGTLSAFIGSFLILKFGSRTIWRLLKMPGRSSAQDSVEARRV